MKKKCLAVLLLAALLLPLFAGCGSQETVSEGNLADVSFIDPASQPQETSISAELSSTIAVLYTAEAFPLPADTHLLSLAPDGDGYAAVTAENSQELLIFGQDFQAKDRVPGTVNTAMLFPSSDGTAYRLSIEGQEVNGQYETTAVLYHGEERLYDLPWPNDFTVGAFFFSEAPNGVYAASFRYVTFNGKELALPQVTTGFEPIVRGIMTFGENRYVVFREESPDASGKFFLCPLTESGLGTPMETNLEGYLYTSGAEYCYYIMNDTLYRTDGSAITACGDLLALGINTNTIVSCFEEDGALIMALDDRIVRLSESADAEAYETLTLGVWNYAPTEIQRAITSFNAEDHGFKVTVKELADETALNLAQVSHELDLIAGFFSPTLEKRARSGLLLPLEDFLDLSPLYPNVVEAGSVSGNCYFLPMGFNLFGWLLPKEVMPERGYFLDFDEFLGALDKLEKQGFYKSQLKADLLLNSSFTGFEEWVDWDNMTCDFDSESFIKYLEFMNRFATDWDEAQANMQSALFTPYGQLGMYPFAGQLIGRFTDAVLGLQTPLSGDAVCFPAPGKGKYHGAAISSEGLLAVPAGLKHEDEVRVFLSYLFSEETQYQMMTTPDDMLFNIQVLSLRRDVTEKRMEELTALFTKVYAEGYAGAPGADDAIARLKENSANTLTLTLEYAAAADHYADRSQSDVSKIVTEEAENYFKGNITAEKAAEYIQNRVMLMLEEQG